MSQVKIYANERTIIQYRELLSHAIHQALIEELKYPSRKDFNASLALNLRILFIHLTEASITLSSNFQCLQAAVQPLKSNLFKPYFAILKSNAKLHLRTLKLPF